MQVTIPIDNTIKNQSFQVSLSNVVYTMTLRYNTIADRWSFGFGLQDGTMIFQGLFLVLGINYLTLIKDARLPQGFLGVVNMNTSTPNAEPTELLLGGDCQLVYDTNFTYE